MCEGGWDSYPSSVRMCWWDGSGVGLILKRQLEVHFLKRCERNPHVKPIPSAVFFYCEETFLEQGGGAVHGYKTVPFNWHDRMKSGLLWDVTCGEKMLRTSGSQEVFRGWQLLHKWQINGTSCLELGTDWQIKSSYLLQALGLLRGTPGILMLAVCLWSRSSLRKKETLPVFFPASRLSCVCLDNRK